MTTEEGSTIDSMEETVDGIVEGGSTTTTKVGTSTDIMEIGGAISVGEVVVATMTMADTTEEATTIDTTMKETGSTKTRGIRVELVAIHRS